MNRSLALIITSYATFLFIVGCTGNQTTPVIPAEEVQSTKVAITPIPPSAHPRR